MFDFLTKNKNKSNINIDNCLSKTLDPLNIMLLILEIRQDQQDEIKYLKDKVSELTNLIIQTNQTQEQLVSEINRLKEELESTEYKAEPSDILAWQERIEANSDVRGLLVRRHDISGVYE